MPKQVHGSTHPGKEFLYPVVGLCEHMADAAYSPANKVLPILIPPGIKVLSFFEVSFELYRSCKV